jgi:hypothetical protein
MAEFVSFAARRLNFWPQFSERPTTYPMTSKIEIGLDGIKEFCHRMGFSKESGEMVYPIGGKWENGPDFSSRLL